MNLVDRATEWLGALGRIPILERDLRAMFRTPRYTRFFYVALAAMTFLVGVIALLGREEAVEISSFGVMLFQILFALLYVAIIVAVPVFSATAITGEREQRTLESLLLSGLSPWQIVSGKFASATVAVGLVIVALAPLAGLTFLFGGVSPIAVVVATYWAFVWVFVAVALGLAISAHAPTSRVALVLTEVTFIPISFIVAMLVTVAGERSDWSHHDSFTGPFWFTDVLVIQFTSLDAWVSLILIPSFVAFLAIWLLVELAMTGLETTGADRSTRLKLWTVVVTGTVYAGAARIGAGPPGVAAQLFHALAYGLATTVIALFAVDHRTTPKRSRTPSFLAWFGPTRVGTQRFSLVASLALGVGTPLVTYAVGHANHAATWSALDDANTWCLALSSVGPILFMGGLAARSAALELPALATRAVWVITISVLSVITLIATASGKSMGSSAADRGDWLAYGPLRNLVEPGWSNDHGLADHVRARLLAGLILGVVGIVLYVVAERSQHRARTKSEA